MHLTTRLKIGNGSPLKRVVVDGDGLGYDQGGTGSKGFETVELTFEGTEVPKAFYKIIEEMLGDLAEIGIMKVHDLLLMDMFTQAQKAMDRFDASTTTE